MTFRRRLLAVMLLCGAVLAQGERTLEPMKPQDRSDALRPDWYVGTAKPRFLNWYVDATYAVLNEPISFGFTFVSTTEVRAVRFTPLSGGSSLRVNLSARNVVLNARKLTNLGQSFEGRITLNASDFAVKAGGAENYRVALLDAGGKEGESFQIAINFRSKSDFQPDPAVARANEPLSGIVPIGFFQALSGGSVFVPNVQNFQSYSRLWLEVRLPSDLDLALNTTLFRLAVNAVSLRDDAGQRYVVEWDDRAVSKLPDGNGFRFALVMTPKLSSTAKRLALVQGSIKAENLPAGLRLDDLREPFRSGLTFDLPLLR